jgi:hypothetical protein
LRRTRFAVKLQTLNIGGLSPQPKEDGSKTSAQTQQACHALKSYVLIYPLPTDWQMITSRKETKGSSHKMQPGQWSALVTCSPHLQVISRRCTSTNQPSGYLLGATQAAAALKILLLLGTSGLNVTPYLPHLGFMIQDLAV